jgi:membrane protease YdiL (CAAX protease family)
MKQVYLARDAAEAHLIAAMLDAAGIKTHILGEHISTLQGAIPFGTASSPALCVVDDLDSEEAQRQIGEFLRHRQPADRTSIWICPQCGESIESQFTACWKCGADRGDVPLRVAGQEIEPEEDEDDPDDAEHKSNENLAERVAPTRSTSELWMETSVVLILAMLPSLYGFVSSLITGQSGSVSFLDDHLYYIMRAVWSSVPVLYLIHRSRESWANFGLVRPRLVQDGLGGILIWAAKVTATTAMWFFTFAWFGGDGLRLFLSNWWVFPRPVGAEYLLLVFSSCAIGFSEELVMRGYLIPRFERLLGSSWKAVAMTTMLFALWHLYQGPGGVIATAVCGLISGVAFCWIRRLWPIALAHALLDFVLDARTP